MEFKKSDVAYIVVVVLCASYFLAGIWYALLNK